MGARVLEVDLLLAGEGAEPESRGFLRLERIDMSGSADRVELVSEVEGGFAAAGWKIKDGVLARL